MVTQFVNNGTDLEVLNKSYESMPLEQQEELAKALKKDGLVLVDVQVNGKHGVYTRKQWKKASDVKKDEGKSSKGAPDTMGALNSVSITDTKSQRALAAALDAAPVGTKIETGMTQMGFSDKGKVSWEKKDSPLSGSKPWVKTGGSNSGFTDTPTGVAQQIASMKARPDKCGKPDFKVHTPDSNDKADTKQPTDKQSNNKQKAVPQVIKGKHMSDLKDNLKEHGLVLDSIHNNGIQDDEEVTMYDKDKNTYTAKASLYSDGGIELRKITKEKKEETVSDNGNDKQKNSGNPYPDYVNKTKVGVPKAHSSSYSSEKKAIEFAKQLHDNGATNIEISSAEDAFNQTQYRVAWDKEEKKQNDTKEGNKPTKKADAPSKSKQDSATTVSVPKTKADIQSMLASGKSRNDIIELAKKSGISWKENGHEGINWMRCCMALTKKDTDSSSTKKKSK